jgi:hypothetical protein
MTWHKGARGFALWQQLIFPAMGHELMEADFPAPDGLQMAQGVSATKTPKVSRIRLRKRNVFRMGLILHLFSKIRQIAAKPYSSPRYSPMG